jgi:hypothetical protein
VLSFGKTTLFVLLAVAINILGQNERQLRPQCHRSPSDFALISFAAAAKVGSEP